MERLEKAYKEIVYNLDHKIYLGLKARLDILTKQFLSKNKNLWINKEMCMLWNHINVDWHYNLTALFILWFMLHYGNSDLDLERLRIEMQWTCETGNYCMWEV